MNPSAFLPGSPDEADDAEVEVEVRRQYRAIYARHGDGRRLAVLHIGAPCCLVATGTEAQPQAVLRLAIGSVKTARDYFRHDIPTPLELENAIMAVEDEVTRAQPQAGGAALFSRDAGIRQIALTAGVTAGVSRDAGDGADLPLSREAVEQTFNRLAAVALGRPAVSEALPGTAAFAATLLILREFMHHLRFENITVV